MRVNKTLIDRLDALVKKSGRAPRDLSIEATGKPDTIRDILRGSSRNPRSDTLQKLASVLGTNVAYLTGNARSPNSGGTFGDGLSYATVIGIAQAGAFQEVADLSNPDNEARRIATVPDEKFPYLEQVAFEIAGDSINLRCEAGGFAVGLPFAETGLDLRVGMWVVADRVRGSLVERTIKQVKGRPGRWELHPDSTNPKHKPIRFPSAEDHEEIVIIAIVRRFISPELPL